MSDINAVVSSSASTQGDTSNSAVAIKSLLQSIITSNQVMDEEKENIKECLETLKNNHGIKPKVARTVANLLNSPEKRQEMEDQQFEIDQLYSKITKSNP